MNDWRRTMFVVWAANLVTSIGMMSFLPFFPSLLREMGMQDDAAVRLWAGACFAAAPLSATIMSPIWGALGDRFGRKVMICRSTAAIALFVGAMAYATSPLQLLFLRVGQGLFSGFIPPSITLVSVQAPADKQGQVAGWLTTSLAIGAMFGPMLGGWTAIRFGSHQAVFHVVAGLALGATLLVALFAREVAPPARESGSERRGPSAAFSALAEDMRVLLANPVLRTAAGIVFAMQFALGAVNPVLEEYITELFEPGGANAVAWGAIFRALPNVHLTDEKSVTTFATSLSFGAMAVANLVSLPFWGRYGDRVGHRRALGLCATGGFIALVIQSLSPRFGVLLVGRMLMGISFGGIGPLAFGLAAAETGADRRGGAMGAVFSARTLAVATGGITGGWLAGRIEMRLLILLVAGGVLVSLFAYARSSLRMRRALSES